jgi:hypothetical protein
MKKYARKCNQCQQLMNKGYVIEGGQEYYCSNKCLNKNITPTEYTEMYNNGEGDSYYTEWEDIDDFQYYENGSEVEK